MSTVFEHEEVPEDDLEKAQLEVILARRAYRQDPASGAERLLAALDALLACWTSQWRRRPIPLPRTCVGSGRRSSGLVL